MDDNSVEEVKENAATNCTKCILPSTVQDDDGRTTEIAICTTNRIKTCSASTSYNIMSSAENAINDLNDGRSEKVETTSAISNDVIQRVESARVEDIMPPRSLNSQKQKQNNSTILKSPSEALPSENSSTISLRTSEDCIEGVQVSELPPRSRSQKVYNTTRAQDPDKNTVFGEPTKRMDKSRTRPHTINNPSNEGTRSKQRSKSSKPTEAPTQTRTSRVNEKLSNPSSATMLMHGYGSMQSPCLSCRMKTSKDYDNTSEGKKRKAVYFNPDLLPPSSKQIDSNGASVCLRRQSSQDMLPLHFSHLVIDSTVSMYSVGSHLEGFLRIQNNSTSHICYRVTSFIPGRYQIIPSTGILEKNQTVALTIASSVPKMFIKFEPDQFQVETIIAPPDVVAPNEQRLLWKVIQS
ncbi:unnamed protein product [Allacma fusca]|uniref:MSP domain-containing protein n=1 Tax=Allacma fusca TaxID=39272 RepID=A0A8J2Q082_9HEXA|nr:unnamed protein product [Allacma fusca]